MTLPTKAACQPSCKHAGWAENTPGTPTLTVMQRLRWVKDGIREGKLAGPQSSFYFGLPHAQRDSYLDGEIQAVHVTPLGLCLHDFAVTPCPYHLNCVRGCSDYLRTRGSVSERR